MPHPLHQHPGERTGSSGDVGGVASRAMLALPSAARAEPALKPNHPHHACISDGHRQVVRRHRLGAETSALTDHHRCHQRRDPGGDMDHDTAGEIDRTHGAEPTAAPHPVRDGYIDSQQLNSARAGRQ